jgi:uncharacterized protein
MMTHSESAGRIFVDPWSPEYGSPNQIDEGSDEESTAQFIDEEGFDFVTPVCINPVPIAFVDGRRRVEALLSQWHNGGTVPGLTGAYGVGAVLALPGQTPVFAREEIRRLIIWSSGRAGTLPEMEGGWRWDLAATSESGPGAALRKLQDMMREADAFLARDLALDGYLVVTDGTLWFPTGSGFERIAGYVKTHHRRLLPPIEAERLLELPAGRRTTIFSTGRRYSCYLRLTERAPFHAPLSGIVRLELSASLPLGEARAMADHLAFVLPSFAGALHIDPRAPQNLQPVSALESRLSHLFGDSGLALRAVREAVLRLEAPIGR